MKTAASAWRPAAVAPPWRRGLSAGLALAAARGLQLLARGLPDRMLWGAATALGRVFYYVVRLRRRVVLDRIACGLSKGDADVHRIARDSYTYAALSLLWLLRLDGLPSPQELISLDEDTRASLASMRTVLASRETPSHAIISHIGFWEILPAALARPVIPVQTQWIVYRPLHNAALNDLVASIRNAPDRRLVADKKCYGLLRDVLQRPNADGTAAQLVGLVADQRCNSERTRTDVSFLGQPTQLTSGAARLHLEGSTLWFAAVLHNKRYYTSTDPTEKPFRLVLRPISTNAMSPTGTFVSKVEVTALVRTTYPLHYQDNRSTKCTLNTRS